MSEDFASLPWSRRVVARLYLASVCVYFGAWRLAWQALTK